MRLPRGLAERPENRCQVRTGLQALSFNAACEAAGGEVVVGNCPADGIVGGCVLMADGPSGGVTDWYYTPETAESAESACGANEPFVEAP